MAFDPETTKHTINTTRLLELLEALGPDKFLTAVEGGLCVHSEQTGELVSVVKFFEEEVMDLRE